MAASLVSLAILLCTTWGQWNYFVVALVYGIGAVCLFSASSLYHAFKKKENDTNIWRKLDHVAIFIMIAGTFTPVAYIYLEGAWFWSLIVIQWSCVILGFFFKVFYMRVPRIISPILYLLMGWMAIIPLHILWQEMPRVSFMFFVAGGAAYSIGAIIYALKRPNLLSAIGFHGIFHIFILAGGILHFFMVYSSIIDALA